MITLGIETSGRAGSVALLRAGEVLGRSDLSQAGRRHAQSLLTELQDLLRRSDLSPREIDTVAVSIGPGSFTGLRVGVACAKAWAYATGCRLVAVDTFLAVARRSKATHTELNVIGDAQRGDLFVGRYRRDSDCIWRSIEEIAIVDVGDWIDSLKGDVAVSGPGVDRLRGRIEGRASLEASESASPHAEEVARIGHDLSNAGIADDLWGLQPLYLRRSAAEEKAEAESRRPQ